MDTISLLKRGMQLSSIFLAAALSTFALFGVLLILIATSFKKREAPVTDIVFVNTETEVTAPKMKAKRLSVSDLSLLEPVELPPAVETKTVPRAVAPKFEAVMIDTVDAQGLFSSRPKISFSKPAGLGFKQPQTTLTASDSTGHVSRQCTLIAHIGPNLFDISGIEIMNCLNGEMADDAERELRIWIESRSDSFRALGATAGDAVEFTYEEKRQNTSSG